MKTPTHLLLWGALTCSLIILSPIYASDLAIPNATQGGVSWQISVPNGGVSLRVSGPDGSTLEQNFAAGQAASYIPQRGVLADGIYNYELVISPVVSPEARVKAQAAREGGQAIDLPSGSVTSGSFRVAKGAVILPDASAIEPQRNTPAAPEQTINGNLTVHDSICAGFDCADSESYGADTIRLKENNLRIHFEDTSVGSFPTRDWRIVANDSTNGGANFLGFEDTDAGTMPFRITAGAGANALFVGSNGNVGLGTSTPVLDLHISNSNTPAMRLEQTSAGGFAAQTWDVAGNETTFFIRDVTNGSKLPFRIQPNSPSASISIANTGNVGLGILNPAGKLHTSGAGSQLVIFQSSDNNAVQFRLQTDSTNRRIVALNTAGAQQGQIVFNDSGAFDFLGATAADQRLTILSSGNIGIGTSAPTQRLSVNGTAGKPGGGSWDVFSDERLKNIKGDFHSGLQALLQLQPIRYEYKPDNALGLQSEGEHVGFGAAAVQKIIPEAVTETPDGYLMINNDPILWTMLNAIKEQNEEISDLKEQVKRLQAEVVLNAEAKKPARKKVAAKNR